MCFFSNTFCVILFAVFLVFCVFNFSARLLLVQLFWSWDASVEYVPRFENRVFMVNGCFTIFSKKCMPYYLKRW